jgi:hypothetical protein
MVARCVREGSCLASWRGDGWMWGPALAVECTAGSRYWRDRDGLRLRGSLCWCLGPGTVGIGAAWSYWRSLPLASRCVLAARRLASGTTGSGAACAMAHRGAQCFGCSVCLGVVVRFGGRYWRGDAVPGSALAHRGSTSGTTGSGWMGDGGLGFGAGRIGAGLRVIVTAFMRTAWCRGGAMSAVSASRVGSWRDFGLHAAGYSAGECVTGGLLWGAGSA